MRRLWILLSLLVLISLACSLTGGGVTPTPTPTPAVGGPRHAHCGDGICNGPENHQRCPQDCAEGEQGGGPPPGGGHPPLRGGTPVAPDERSTATPTAESTTETSADATPMVGAILAHADLTRDAGRGSCGIDPWRSSLCTSGADWWGLHLEAAIVANVLIIPDGEGRWVITNHGDVVSRYGYDPAEFTDTTGYYQDAQVDPSINPECHAQIRGNDFDSQIMGTRENGEIVLTISATPEEHMWGTCGMTSFDWHLHNLLYGWAAAYSGDPMDMTATLTDDDLDIDLRGNGVYHHTYTVDTNPSPDNRDHVEAKLTFMCAVRHEPKSSTDAEGYDSAPCPWNQ